MTDGDRKLIVGVLNRITRAEELTMSTSADLAGCRHMPVSRLLQRPPVWLVAALHGLCESIAQLTNRRDRCHQARFRSFDHLMRSAASGERDHLPKHRRSPRQRGHAVEVPNLPRSMTKLGLEFLHTRLQTQELGLSRIDIGVVKISSVSHARYIDL